MNPLDRLDRLNQRQRRLDEYAARVRMAFWMPKTRDRVLSRISKKFRQNAAERTRVLDLIKADPVLRQRLREREDQVKARQRTKERGSVGPSGPAAPLPDKFHNEAMYVVSLKETERLARDAYQEAVWYYKWGDWKTDGVAVEEVTALLDTLKHEMQRATRSRVEAQQSFEDGIREALSGDPQHIVHREELLASVRRTEPSNSLNGFQRWLGERTTERDEPEPELEGINNED